MDAIIFTDMNNDIIFILIRLHYKANYLIFVFVTI